MADEDRPVDEPERDDSPDGLADGSGDPVDASRRRWMKTATVAIGGVIGAVTAFPLIRYFWHPVGRKVVVSADEPIDIMSVRDLELDAPPVRVKVAANGVRDAWSVADNYPLGAAWVRKVKTGEGEQIVAFSASCPHLGCSVGFVGDSYLCRCHNSSFAIDGEKTGGPAKRGLDPLETLIEGDRLLIRWKKFKKDVAEREEV